MLYGTLFTLPDAETILASTSEYSVPLFSDFLPLIYLVGGVGLGLLLIFVIIRAVTPGHK